MNVFSYFVSWELSYVPMVKGLCRNLISIEYYLSSMVKWRTGLIQNYNISQVQRADLTVVCLEPEFYNLARMEGTFKVFIQVVFICLNIFSFCYDYSNTTGIVRIVIFRKSIFRTNTEKIRTNKSTWQNIFKEKSWQLVVYYGEKGMQPRTSC